ncbi:hypothetical protein PR048_007526 [Dryococelus australis]|uniref:Uncharacterized protein n=1 Tax=Dryococelus australis TaxID=614101 RepID=A0ABQ9HUK7_9NEOP|nr:hypothetical protein PR048_007526 [Dryococelus australis]
MVPYSRRDLISNAAAILPRPRHPFGCPPFRRPRRNRPGDRNSHESARVTRRRRAHTQLTSLSAGPLWHPTVVMVRLLAYNLGEPVSIPGGVAPGYLHAVIVPDEAAVQRVFPGISRFLTLAFQRCYTLTSLHPHRLSRPRWVEMAPDLPHPSQEHATLSLRLLIPLPSSVNFFRQCNKMAATGWIRPHHSRPPCTPTTHLHPSPERCALRTSHRPYLPLGTPYHPPNTRAMCLEVKNPDNLSHPSKTEFVFIISKAPGHTPLYRFNAARTCLAANTPSSHTTLPTRCFAKPTLLKVRKGSNLEVVDIEGIDVEGVHLDATVDVADPNVAGIAVNLNNAGIAVALNATDSNGAGVPADPNITGVAVDFNAAGVAVDLNNAGIAIALNAVVDLSTIGSVAYHDAAGVAADLDVEGVTVGLITEAFNILGFDVEGVTVVLVTVTVLNIEDVDKSNICRINEENILIRARLAKANRTDKQLEIVEGA